MHAGIHTPLPLVSDTPWEQTHPRAPEQTPPPGADTPQSRHPPCTVHTGRYGQQVGGTHPTGMHTSFEVHSQFSVQSMIKYCSQTINK